MNKLQKYTQVILGAVFILSFYSAHCMANETASLSNLRDPTRPIGVSIKSQSPSEKETRVSLSAIFYKDSGSSAIISGERLMEGDAFAGFRVKKIFKNKVVLAGKGEDLVLTLYPDLVKKR